ncbi:uncharacterized protein PV09_08754 [Verruconis gallopava]|uniref:Uncharacterized protein n=1 Tax=Verruconis gallopava TaxID=253628 RepID=A0A0D1ZYT2_9PEZI|nr:uncharacterized protein PV09_08754 [Verruconis gallopava]KIV99577.1 hypothetical protein PV09_08754 [Verruconis gallopava]
MASLFRFALGFCFTTVVLAASSTSSSSSATSSRTSTSAPAAASASSAATPDDTAQFGTVQQILGNMDRTDIDFADGLAIDVLSPKNRTFVVTQNKNPLGAQFVTNSTGENFTALLPYSYVIKLNETAQDLIGKVELPYDPAQLAATGFNPANTYVGRLAPDGKSWDIMENQRNVHVTENKTRIIKMTSMDGEYLLLGRKSTDTANIFVQYGQGETRTANFTGGPGVQQSEFIDGLRFTVEANSPIRMNVEIRSPVNTSQIPAGMRLLNSFSYVVNTSTPTATNQSALRSAKIDFPINPALLSRALGSGQAGNGTARTQRADVERAEVMIARRDSGATNAKFAAVSKQTTKLSGAVDKVQLQQTTSLDGEYVLLVSPTTQSVGEQANGGQEKKSVASAATGRFTVRPYLGSTLLSFLGVLMLLL